MTSGVERVLARIWLAFCKVGFVTSVGDVGIHHTADNDAPEPAVMPPAPQPIHPDYGRPGLASAPVTLPAADVVEAAGKNFAQTPSADPTGTLSNIHTLHQHPAATFMLAARLASQRALNPPKALARRPGRLNSSAKPIPKRSASQPASRRSAKPRHNAKAPRVLRPIGKSAEILYFSGHLAKRPARPHDGKRAA